MDITSIIAKPRAIDIIHPGTKQPIGLRITLLHESDPAFKASIRKALDESLRGSEKPSAEGFEKRNQTVAIAGVKALEWSEGCTFNGKTPAASEVALKEIFDTLPWLQEQVNRELLDQAAFFLDSAAA